MISIFNCVSKPSFLSFSSLFFFLMSYNSPNLALSEAFDELYRLSFPLTNSFKCWFFSYFIFFCFQLLFKFRGPFDVVPTAAFFEISRTLALKIVLEPCESNKMAIESIGKRSTRDEIYHAGGDNILLKGGFSDNVEDRLSIEMVERESDSEQQERRYFGGLIGKKELSIMVGTAVCMYLVNGEYAQSVCTALTSVPPAVFSYRVLINQQTTKQGYHTILFYWTIYGLIALLDQFVGSAQGYNLCKGGLLGVVFFHAVRSNSEAIPPAWKFLDKASVDILTALLSRYDSNVFLPNNHSGCAPRTPTMTQFSDDFSQYIFPESEVSEIKEEEISTACSFQPSLEMQSTQRGSFGNVQKSTVSALKTMVLEDDELVNQTPSSANKKTDFQSMSAKTLSPRESADVVAFPADRIIFSENNREEAVQVTNVSAVHVMFALKTNADTYLIAAPTSGILLSGQSMKIRVGVTEQFFDDCSDPGVFIDKTWFLTANRISSRNGLWS